MSSEKNFTSPYLVDGCYPPHNGSISRFTSEDKWVHFLSIMDLNSSNLFSVKLIRIALTTLLSLITIIAVGFSFIEIKHAILECFNFRKHLITLFDLKSTSNEISCLHGIRAVIMMFVLIFHSVTTQGITVDPKSEAYTKNSDAGSYVQITLMACVVDAFFVIGAILVTRAMLRDLRRWA